MNNRDKLFLILIFVILGILLVKPAWASDAELPAVKVALSDDQSIIIHRIVYEAVKRSGYQMVPQVTGMRTAIADVNYGESAVLALQTDGWGKKYENLLQVPVVISNVVFNTYTRSGDTSEFSDWSDIGKLRIGYRWQNEYVVNNIRKIGASKFVEVTTYDELWGILLNNEADVIILPANQHYEQRIPRGIRNSGIIEIQPCYSYVSKRYAHLLPLLKNAYEEMYADGTMTMIYNSREVSGGKRIILHINSYNAQIEWEYRQMDSIRENLKLDSKYEYRNIDLNSNELHSRVGFNTVISDLIRTDYITRYPDLIFASGNEALDFVLNNYYLLFPRIPVVFFGTLGLDDTALYGFEEYISGVSETIPFRETVSGMLRLYPKTRRIFILNDNFLPRSQKLHENIQQSIDSGILPVEFVFSEDKSLAEILDEIRDFGLKQDTHDTLVLIGNYLIDSEGISYAEKDLKVLVAAASANPVFCMNASYIGYGTLGGLVMDLETQSGIAASMAVKILNNTAPRDIPTIFDTASLNQWQFDHEALKKFAIKESSLPEGYIIVNRLLPVWETNPLEFRLMALVAILLLLIIFALVVFSRMLAKKQREAEAASRAKSSFLANMSHEIRTPMNSIIGFSELALDDTVTPKIKEYLDMIKENAKGLLQIINNILDLSKIESGSVNLESIPFDLHGLLESCRAIILPRAAEKNISLRLYNEFPSGRMLLGDPTRLRQVLLNLLSNAVKFTNTGTVKLVVLMCSETKNNVILRFIVEDSGIGMTDEQIKKIFEPFIQGDISTTRKYGGTGLGLAITKNLLDLMGSMPEIKSTPDIGTVIAFELVFKLANAADTQDKTMPAAGAVKKTDKPSFEGEILVCEDNQMNQRVIAENLAKVGLHYEIAENGQKGVDRIRSRIDMGKKPFDLILMDIHMPVMDGLEAATKILDMGTLTPIVAMTANVMMDDREHYKAVGINDYLCKPFMAQDLWHCLLRYLKPVGFISVSDTEIGNEDRDNKLRTDLRKDFVRNNQTKYAEIQNALDSGDTKLAYRLAHTLKSNAALIGKTALQKTAAGLEAALKDHENPVGEKLSADQLRALTMAPMEDLNDKLAAVLDELGTSIIESDDPVQPVNTVFGADRTRELTENLEALLKCGDTKCLNLIEELKAIPGSGELIKQMEDFSFGEAREALLKLKEELRERDITF